MKKFFLPAAAVMAFGFIATLSSCSNGSQNESKSADAAGAKTELSAEGSETALAQYVRYVDMDSITANYVLAKEFSQAYAKAATDLQNYAKNQQAPIEKLQNEIQTKYQQGIYLSQASMDADVNRAQTMAQQASNRVEARQREYDTQLQSLQMALQDSIQHFFNDYVAEKHYDAILYKSDCIYVNPALDITDEVIKGLNERYKPAGGAAK